MTQSVDVLNFWFEEIAPSKWWTKDADFDQEVRDRFIETHAQAMRCELFEWRETAEGRLAEIVVLDQFSRNMFHGSKRSFESDGLALALAQEAIDREFDKALTPIQNSFLYMPFMHSESIKIHEVAVGLYQRNGIEDNLNFELKHKVIIDRFGRYPHRNAILGRESTQEEIAFLSEPGSAF